jgi:pimeloyl-ACP methyl ester carboxylesterase
MIIFILVAALVMLVLTTQVGVVLFQHRFPARGETVEVRGARLNLLDIGPKNAAGPPIVMIHGASCNLETMRWPLGERLAKDHRVILIDRPGHGWSSRTQIGDTSEEAAPPAAQGRMIEEALEKLGAGPVVLVVHSWAGALGARMAIDFPARVAGLVMLAPVAYPWAGGVGWFNQLVTWPLIGPMLAHTIVLPLGCLLMRRGAREAFLPQTVPDNFITETAVPLVLRPREFVANARDLVRLKQAVTEQAPRYAEILAPTLVISGDADKAVSTNIHSRPFAAAVRNAGLIVLPGVGHMVQNAAPDLVAREIETMIEGRASTPSFRDAPLGADPESIVPLEFREK